MEHSNGNVVTQGNGLGLFLIFLGSTIREYKNSERKTLKYYTLQPVYMQGLIFLDDTV